MSTRKRLPDSILRLLGTPVPSVYLFRVVDKGLLSQHVTLVPVPVRSDPNCPYAALARRYGVAQALDKGGLSLAHADALAAMTAQERAADAACLERRIRHAARASTRGAES